MADSQLIIDCYLLNSLSCAWCIVQVIEEMVWEAGVMLEGGRINRAGFKKLLRLLFLYYRFVESLIDRYCAVRLLSLVHLPPFFFCSDAKLFLLYNHITSNVDSLMTVEQLIAAIYPSEVDKQQRKVRVLLSVTMCRALESLHTTYCFECV